MTPAKAMRTWLRNASPQEARELAKIAGTSRAYLRHIAAGRREVGAELAQRLAHAADRLNIGHALDQRVMCKACSRCNYANTQN